MVQIFFNIIDSIRIPSIEIKDINTTLQQVNTYITTQIPILNQTSYYLTTNSILLQTNEILQQVVLNHINHPMNINICIRMLGGKGGFGKMLRDQGGRMASIKTTNFESSRDLSGRRLRTLNEAQKLADYIASEPERKRKQQERIEKKIKQGLKEIPAKVLNFNETQFNEEHEHQVESISSALDEALTKSHVGYESKPKKVVKKVTAWADDSESDSESDEDDDE